MAARFAVFVRKWNPERHVYGRPRFVGHTTVFHFGLTHSESMRSRAIDDARREYPREIGVGDYVEVKVDSPEGTPCYGTAPWSPGGTGLL